ncbi:hypothetical protein Bca101_072262 [Brassica carinata]
MRSFHEGQDLRFGTSFGDPVRNLDELELPYRQCSNKILCSCLLKCSLDSYSTNWD